MAIGGGGFDIANSAITPLKRNDTGLQTLQQEARLAGSLNDFFVARSLSGIVPDLDSIWDTTLRLPAQGITLAIYSRRMWNTGIVAANFIPPNPNQPIDANFYLGFEAGGAARTGLAAFFVGGTVIKGAYFTGIATSLLITALMPINWLTVIHTYTVKLNKSSSFFFVDDTLVAVMLNSLPEAIPIWNNVQPYALSGGRSMMATSMPTILETHVTVQIDRVNNNCFVADDGDPNPPFQFALYNDSTATKWNNQVVAAGTITSHPVPIWGYENKTLYFMANQTGILTVDLYINGAWRTVWSSQIIANTMEIRVIDFKQSIMRCTFTPGTYPCTILSGEVHVS